MSRLDELAGEFEDIAQEFFPGSKRTITRHINRATEKPAHRPAETGDWDDKPRLVSIKGQQTECFTVGHLARALDRQPGTIRKWEREGVIPKPTFRLRSDDPRGTRRLYTRAQVEGIVRIAADEGVLVSHQKPIKDTRFTERVVALFKALQEGSQ